MASLFKRLGIVSKDLQGGASARELEVALLSESKEMKESSDKLTSEELSDRNLERFYGMDNLGNTCYCNSVLQSLYFCRPLRELVLALPSDTERSMYTVLRRLFVDISTQPKRTGIARTKSFVDRLRNENELFRSTTHQDAHEFLNFLLNRVAEDLTRLTSAPHTLVHSLFEGTLTNETKCMTCENITHRDESFLDLSINVEEDSNVTECLSNFSTREMLCQKNKFFCDSCGGLQEAEKWMRIKKLPNILALHLKRFKYQEEQNRYIKLSYRVAFPFLLEPSSLSSTCQGAENSDRMYSLFAVIIHIGSGPHHGHYVSIIKSYDRWVLFDDDKVSVVDEHELSKFFGNDPAGEGYVFFYETVDLDRKSVGLPERPPSQQPLEKVEDDSGSSKGSYIKKKGSFSAPPSPNLAPLTSASKVNSTTKLNQVMTAGSGSAGEKEDKKSKEADKEKAKEKRKGSDGSGGGAAVNGHVQEGGDEHTNSHKSADSHSKAADVKRSVSQSSRKSLNMTFGLGADRIGHEKGEASNGSSRSKSGSGGSSNRRPSSSGSLFSKKERVSSRPSTSHGSSAHEKERSWFGSLRLKSGVSNSIQNGTGDDEHASASAHLPAKPRVRSDSNPHKASDDVKRSRRRSHTYSSSSNSNSNSTNHDSNTPTPLLTPKMSPTHSSSSQFASGMPAAFANARGGGMSSAGTANGAGGGAAQAQTPAQTQAQVQAQAQAYQRNPHIAPPPPLMSGKNSAATVRREREQLEREKYAKMKGGSIGHGHGKSPKSPPKSPLSESSLPKSPKSPMSPKSPLSPSQSTHTPHNDIGSSPMMYHPPKQGKKNIISKWIDKMRH
ncbi:hypothetical protein E3P99_00987 [Wallemia hederae]|uniref:Ubiquitin carboxyl-terminal hydrolase n=1 Tax=Wallemia hederae TaxID=1540922 RepID=A0A4T0FU24_9BASI|nr:hypothetical protein E3P99_00987 [Wallemia hederae]